MELTAVFLGLLASASIAANLFLYRKLKSPSKRTQTQDLQEFLGDLMYGKLGMIAVARVNPDDVLYKSPRRHDG